METGFCALAAVRQGLGEGSSQICLPFSQRRSSVLILALAARPYQQILPFFFPLFQTCWLRILLESGEKEVKEEGNKERRKTAPGLEEDIVCMCTEAQGLWPAA